jgi:mRNA interferase MazF
VVNRGEVWWVDHPAQGRRPFLVLTRQAVIPVVSKVTGVPATKRVRGIPSEVPLSADDGMPVDRVLNLDNLTLLRKGLVRGADLPALTRAHGGGVPGAVGGHGC